MQRLIILFFSCFFLLQAMLMPDFSQAEKKMLDLEKIVQIAQENNPRIDVARQQCVQGKGLLTQAKSGYLPHLSVGGSVARQNIDNLAPDDEDTVTHGNITASQLIYDFGHTGGAIESSRMSLQAADDNLYQVRQDVVLDSKQAFYDVLAKERLVEVERQAVGNFEQQLYRAKKYFEAGVRTKIDVTNARVELSNSKLALLRAKSDLKTSMVRLEQVLGLKPNHGAYYLSNNEGTLEGLAGKKPTMPSSLDELLSTSFKQRSDIQAVKALVLAAQAEIRRAKSGYFPSVSANAGYDEYNTDLSSISDQWRVGVDLSWELFSGFQTEGEMLTAKGKLKELRAVLRDLELAISQNATDSFLRAEENKEGVDIADETLGLAKENFYMASERYKAGLNDMIEYNDAQLLLSRAQSNLVVTYYDYLIALARLEHAIGMTPELEIRDRGKYESCQVTK